MSQHVHRCVAGFTLGAAGRHLRNISVTRGSGVLLEPEAQPAGRRDGPFDRRRFHPYLSAGRQSATARGREPRSRSSSGRGGRSWQHAAGEDPERAGGHRPVAAPYPQRSAEPGVGGGLVMPAAPSSSCFYRSEGSGGGTLRSYSCYLVLGRAWRENLWDTFLTVCTSV